MDYNRPVDHVVGQIRHICGPKIPFAVCRRLASNIIPEFPNLCDHDDDGVVIDEGTGSLGKKLKNRNSYLNRSQVAEQLDIIRKLGNDIKRQCRAGVKKKYFTSGHPYITRTDLCMLANNELSADVLNETKFYIRYKMDSTDIKTLITELPCLKQKGMIDFHFAAATGKIADEFTRQFYLKKKKKLHLSRTYRNKTLHLTNSATDLEIILGLGRLLRENVAEFIHQFQVSVFLFINRTSIQSIQAKAGLAFAVSSLSGYEDSVGHPPLDRFTLHVAHLFFCYQSGCSREPFSPGCSPTF